MKAALGAASAYEAAFQPGAAAYDCAPGRIPEHGPH
jgi:hypothetical protein